MRRKKIILSDLIMVEMEKEAGHTTAVMVATCPLCGQVLLSSSEMSQHVSRWAVIGGYPSTHLWLVQPPVRARIPRDVCPPPRGLALRLSGVPLPGLGGQPRQPPAVLRGRARWHVTHVTMNPHHNLHNAAACPFEMFKIPKPINTT